MIDILVFLMFLLVDAVSSFWGGFLYLLLLFPPYLFVRGYSSQAILFGGGFVVLFGELLHQNTLGSYMLGVGVALFLFHFFLDVINWHYFLPQAACLLFYFLVLLMTRTILGRVLTGQWVIPELLPFLWTYFVGVLFILIRLYQGRGVRSQTSDRGGL